MHLLTFLFLVWLKQRTMAPSNRGLKLPKKYERRNHSFPSFVQRTSGSKSLDKLECCSYRTWACCKESNGEYLEAANPLKSPAEISIEHTEFEPQNQMVKCVMLQPNGPAPVKKFSYAASMLEWSYITSGPNKPHLLVFPVIIMCCMTPNLVRLLIVIVTFS